MASISLSDRPIFGIFELGLFTVGSFNCCLIHASLLRFVTSVRSGQMLPPTPLNLWQFIQPLFRKSFAPSGAQDTRNMVRTIKDSKSFNPLISNSFRITYLFNNYNMPSPGFITTVLIQKPDGFSNSGSFSLK